MLRAALRRKSAVLAGLVILTCSGAVVWNALERQTLRHPSPLFGSKTLARQVAARRSDAGAPVPPASVPPLPVARPNEALLAQPAPADQEPARTGSVADPIADIIKGGPAGAASKPESQKSLASAQKALTKLGYGPLKPDGVMGTGTRQALERFERDTSLPVTGALGARTARLLGIKAGMTVTSGD